MTDAPDPVSGEEHEAPTRTRFVDPPAAEPEPTPEPVAPPDTEPEPAGPVEEPSAPAAPVDVPPTTDGPVALDSPPPEAPRGNGLLWAAVAALTAVCVVLLVLVVRDLRDRPDADYEAQAKPALAAAKSAAKQVLSYDYRTLEPGFQKALSLTTDLDRDCKAKTDRTSKAYDARARCFRTEFSLTHSRVVVDLATRYKAVVTADVGAAGVVGVAGDRVTVLLYVNQQSVNNQAANPKITQDRVEMVMQKVKGRWLVAGITAL